MLPMPVLGIIQGSVSGFGVALCSTFDLVFADSATANFNFEGLGVESGTYVANRFRSVSKVEALVSSKTTLSAEEAYGMLLATQIFSGDQELKQKVEEVCQKVSITGPNGVAQQKRYVQKLSMVPITAEQLALLAGHIGYRTAFD